MCKFLLLGIWIDVIFMFFLLGDFVIILECLLKYSLFKIVFFWEVDEVVVNVVMGILG